METYRAIAALVTLGVLERASLYRCGDGLVLTSETRDRQGGRAAFVIMEDGRLAAHHGDRGRHKELATGEAAVEAFVAEMDKETTDCFAAAGYGPKDLSAPVYNWLLGRSERQVNKALGARRRQATVAYPLIPLIVADLGRQVGLRARDKDALSRVPKAIDEARPLADALAEHYELPPRCIRLLHDLRLRDIVPEEGGWRFQIGAFISNLKHIPPGMEPKSPSEWESYRAVGNVSWSVLKHEVPANGMTSSDAEREEMGEYRKKVRDSLFSSAARGWSDLDASKLRMLSADDVGSDFAANLVAPILAKNGHEVGIEQKARKAASRILFQDRTLKQVVQMSDWWHARRDTIRRHLQTAYPLTTARYGKLSWLPLCDSFKNDEGWTVEPLSDEDALRAEHEDMGHCVDDYGSDCAYEGTHILSVKSAGGKRVSTVEIRESVLRDAVAGKCDIEDAIYQHEARDRRQPPKKAKKAMQDWMAAVLDGTLKIDFGKLATAKTVRRMAVGGKSVFGSMPPCYDASKEGSCETAWTEYSQLLPNGIRRAGLASLEERCLELAGESVKADAEADDDHHDGFAYYGEVHGGFRI